MLLTPHIHKIETGIYLIHEEIEHGSNLHLESNADTE